MAENSKIEWTDHTFNPWWGCEKVSQGCKFCYAEVLDGRYHEGIHWGPNSKRKKLSPNYWLQPHKWNKDAQRKRIRAKVFCASMADVFEDHPDVIEERFKLFIMIEHTPNLIWQILTKRPENIFKMIPEHWLNNGLPDNVWLGTSVEDQANDERITHLCNPQIKCSVKFLSCEPLLGPIDLGKTHAVWGTNERGKVIWHPMIQWLIVGGESGNAKEIRPMYFEWADNLRLQCEQIGIPFFFKQWGEYIMLRLGKKITGNELNGKQYLNFPK